ncbi:hypothetical protein B0T25DRAFT_634188 [Lasiosphaeria hispida]|uniref:DNA-binding protein REB1 n=1 Tax=Lasiosphaeria hispida TaxID=260671 RepID=A0AAJ0HC11_9PEZI|nr:hypothetical protein B0T25DRAFT_634188 [Lasiosphaeria hispida]
MGNEPSVPVRPGFEGEEHSSRSRSVSPLPRYQHPLNNAQGAFDDLSGGLLRFPSTMPLRNHSPINSLDAEPPPAATQPELTDKRVSKKKRKKKKRRRNSIAEADGDQGLNDNGLIESVADENEEAIVPSKKKKKRQSRSASQHRDEDNDGGAPRTIDPALSITLVARNQGDSQSSPTSTSLKRKKRRRSKKALDAEDEDALPAIAEDDLIRPLEEAVGIIPSSIQSPRKRERQASSSVKSHKKQRRGSPSSPAGEEYSGLSHLGGGFSLLASHLSGNSHAVAALYNSRSAEQHEEDEEPALGQRILETQQSQDGARASILDNKNDDQDREEPAFDQKALAPASHQLSLRTASQRSSQAVRNHLDNTTELNSGIAEVDNEDYLNSEQFPEMDSEMEVDSVPRPQFDADDIESVSSNAPTTTRSRRTRELSIESESQPLPDRPASPVSDDGEDQLLEDAEDEEMPDAEELPDSDNLPAEDEATAKSTPISKQPSNEEVSDVDDDLADSVIHDLGVSSESGRSEEVSVRGGSLANGNTGQSSEASWQNSQQESRDVSTVSDPLAGELEEAAESEAEEAAEKSDGEQEVGDSGADQAAEKSDAEQMEVGSDSEVHPEEPQATTDEDGDVEEPASTPAIQPRSARSLRARSTRQARPIPTKDVYEPQSSSADESPDATPAPPPASAKTPGSRKGSRKRKAKTPFFARDHSQESEGNAEAFAELTGGETAAPAKTLRAKKPKDDKQPKKATKKAAKKSARGNQEEQFLVPGQYRSGALTELEKLQINRAVERIRDNENLSQDEINRIIHENPQLQKGSSIHHQLWALIQESCPTRPRQKLINWCRQQYHNYVARGKWTTEQDDELAELIEIHGKRWSEIAGLINRHQKDVRDRYRNYLVVRDTIKLDTWSNEEEERLYEAIQQAMNRIRGDKKTKNPTKEDVEELINWHHISEAMGFTRSRLQCLRKWKHLGETDAIPQRIATIIPPGSSFRLGKARKDLQKMTVRDKYALASAIRDSDINVDARIPWKLVGHEYFKKKFERKALVVAWGRLRQSVPDEESKTTAECARYLCDMFEIEGNFGSHEAADLADSDVEALLAAAATPMGTPSSSAPASVRKTRSRRTPKSAAFKSPRAGRLSEQVLARTYGSALNNGNVRRKRAPSPVEEDERVVEESSQEEVSTKTQEPVPEDEDDDEDADDDASDSEAPPARAASREASVDLGFNAGEPEPAAPLPQPSVLETPSTRRPKTYGRKALPTSRPPLRSRKITPVAAKHRRIRNSMASEEVAPENSAAEEPIQSPKVATRSSKTRRVRRASTPSDVDEAVAGTPNKRRKTVTAEDIVSPGFTAINRKLARIKPGEEANVGRRRAATDFSSDMDDMDDIPAKIPASRG